MKKVKYNKQQLKKNEQVLKAESTGRRPWLQPESVSDEPHPTSTPSPR